MPKRIAISTLNASTLDILNTIRANASFEYQQNVPEINNVSEIPRVGEVLYGYPALANQFINALVNQIALVRVKSATFNNAYAELKKGYLEFGETVEEVFVELAKAREFSPEKAEARELKRTLPDVRTAFHVMNWRAQYPITIQDNELRMAFQSANGVQELIAKIIDAVYTAAEYDEYLLFKYLLIKAISHGKMKPVSIGDGTLTDAAVAFRGTSNMLTFVKKDYNEAGVHVATPKKDQYIFMDAMFNAEYDVNVLASAFNMDKAEFAGKLKLIDDWATFDNDRFEQIRANSDMIEEVTTEELELMKGVKAVLLDGEWFQVYDNTTKFTENFVSAGLYWNYNLNVWKTVSSSPFSNAVVFVTNEVNAPATIEVKAIDVIHGDNATIVTLAPVDKVSANNHDIEFVQTSQFTEKGVAVHKYGAYIFPHDKDNFNTEYRDMYITVNANGHQYSSMADDNHPTMNRLEVYTRPSNLTEEDEIIGQVQKGVAVGDTFTLKMFSE